MANAEEFPVFDPGALDARIVALTSSHVAPTRSALRETHSRLGGFT